MSDTLLWQIVEGGSERELNKIHQGGSYQDLFLDHSP